MSTTYNHLKKYITRHSIVNQDTNELEKKREFEKQKKKKRISLYVNMVEDVTPLFYFQNTAYRGPHPLFKHKKIWDNKNNKTPGITKNNKILQDKLYFESGICSVNLLRFP